MMTKASAAFGHHRDGSAAAAADDDDDGGGGGGVGGGGDDAVLVWHSSGQQGLVLQSSAGAWQLAEGGCEGVMAVAMEGGDVVNLGPGDVLVDGDGGGCGQLVARRTEGGGLRLMRFTWMGGYKGLNQRECGEWAGHADPRCEGEGSSRSSNCTVVLAFAASADNACSSFLMASARFACGYDDGESDVRVTYLASHVTRHTSLVTRHTSHVTRMVGSIVLCKLDGSSEALSLREHEQEACCITGRPRHCCSWPSLPPILFHLFFAIAVNTIS
jgi:hypothetical protein